VITIFFGYINFNIVTIFDIVVVFGCVVVILGYACHESGHALGLSRVVSGIGFLAAVAVFVLDDVATLDVVNAAGSRVFFISAAERLYPCSSKFPGWIVAALA